MDIASELLNRIRQILKGRRFGSPPSSDDDGDVLVGAPLKPRPPLSSGAIALPLPDSDER